MLFINNWVEISFRLLLLCRCTDKKQYLLKLHFRASLCISVLVIAYFGLKIAYFGVEIAYFRLEIAYFGLEIAYFDVEIAYLGLVLSSLGLYLLLRTTDSPEIKRLFILLIANNLRTELSA